MLSALHRMPSLFSYGSEPKGGNTNIFVSMSLSEDGKQLVVTASSPSAKYCSTFDENGLTKAKATAVASMQWSEFFEELEKGMSTKEVKFSYDGNNLVCAVSVGQGAASFPLQKQQQSPTQGQAQILLMLYEAYVLRTDKNAEDQQLAYLTKKENEWNLKTQTMKQQKVQLTEFCNNAVDEEKALQRQHDQLRQELDELLQQRAGEVGDSQDDVNVSIEPDFNTCVGRVPGGEMICKNLDRQLMKILKSKFLLQNNEDNDDEDPVYNKVIRPETRSWVAMEVEKLGDSMKGLVVKCFNKIDDWDFDVFCIQDFTDKGSLFIVAYALLVKYDFFQKFRLDEQIVCNFLTQVEAGYHPNPYHNSMHAADVLHILHYILTKGELAKQARLSDEDVFAALLAGMIHDYDHPGINNNFHMRVQSYLATLYNDKSILENHHCAEIFELLKNPNFNILAVVNDEQKRDIRETVIDMVLSTDMGLHAKILGSWKKRIAQDLELHGKKEDQRLTLAIAIKMADISNCGRPEQLYLKWSAKISEEFFLQGDRERNLGYPVSPFMDRNIPSMAKGQIAFMNFIVIPLFESVSEYLSEMHFSVDHCDQNKLYWNNNSDDLL